MGYNTYTCGHCGITFKWDQNTNTIKGVEWKVMCSEECAKASYKK
jgi:hypothetical protein